jgi:hypothetical protein
VIVERPTTVTRFIVAANVSAGNIDVGIYDAGYNRVVSTGSVTMVSSSGLGNYDIADTFLSPGRYWLALALSDTATARLRQFAVPAGLASLFGIQIQNSALPLPSTASPSAMTAATVYPYIGAHSPGATP